MVGRPFPKGVSGNPGGRPRMPEALRNRIEAAAEGALDTLIALHADTAQAGSVRSQAAVALIHLAYGKPAQSLAISQEGNDEAAAKQQHWIRETLLEAARKAHEGMGSIVTIAVDDVTVGEPPEPSDG